MNPILHPIMGKCLGRLDSSTLEWQPVLEKENFEFKTSCTPLKKKIDLKSHSACGEGVGYLYIYIYIVDAAASCCYRQAYGCKRQQMRGMDSISFIFE